jgi:hypothetical protein
MSSFYRVFYSFHFINHLKQSKVSYVFMTHPLGQAGRGNNEEFGLLSLEFDENFCMGGPGIIMSRQTLKRGKFWFHFNENEKHFFR